MSNAISIPQTPRNAVVVSVSPTTPSPLHDRIRRKDSMGLSVRSPKVLHPVDNEDLRLLLLENISQDAVKAFRAQGFHVDHSTKAMSEDELVEKISSYHAIGIRSKTKITERVIKAASKVCVPSKYFFGIVYDCTVVARHRLFLYRNKSSRFAHSIQSWHPRIQLPILQLALRCRIGLVRSHRAFPPVR